MKKNIRKISLWSLMGLAAASLIGSASLVAFSRHSNNQLVPQYFDSLTFQQKNLSKQFDKTSPSKQAPALDIQNGVVMGFKDYETIKDKFTEGSIHLVIPEKDSKGHPVTQIATGAFVGGIHHQEEGERHPINGGQFLLSVTIPKTVKKLEPYCFYECRYLNTVNLSEGLETIGKRAFAYSDTLKNIIFPSTLTDIGVEAFYDAIFEEIVIPKKMSNIKESVFINCPNLKSVLLPNPKLSYNLGYQAFASTKALTNFTVISPSVKMDQHGSFNDDWQDTITLWVNGENARTALLDTTTSRHGFPYKQIKLLNQVGDFYTRSLNLDTTELAGLSSSGMEKESLVIPENVSSIPSFTFACCSDSLNKIEIKGKNVKFGEHALYGIPKQAKFLVHDSETRTSLMNRGVEQKYITLPNPLSAGSIAAIIVSVILVALGGLGAGIAFLMRKQHRINTLNAKLTNRRIDKLAMGNAMAFKKVIEATGVINKKVDQISSRQALAARNPRPRAASAPRYQPTNEPTRSVQSTRPARPNSPWKSK